MWVWLWRLGLQELCYQSPQMECSQPKVLPKGLHIGPQLDVTGLYDRRMQSIVQAVITVHVDEMWCTAQVRIAQYDVSHDSSKAQHFFVLPQRRSELSKPAVIVGSVNPG